MFSQVTIFFFSSRSVCVCVCVCVCVLSCCCSWVLLLNYDDDSLFLQFLMMLLWGMRMLLFLESWREPEAKIFGKRHVYWFERFVGRASVGRPVRNLPKLEGESTIAFHLTGGACHLKFDAMGSTWSLSSSPTSLTVAASSP